MCIFVTLQRRYHALRSVGVKCFTHHDRKKKARGFRRTVILTTQRNCVGKTVLVSALTAILVRDGTDVTPNGPGCSDSGHPCINTGGIRVMPYPSEISRRRKILLRISTPFRCTCTSTRFDCSQTKCCSFKARPGPRYEARIGRRWAKVSAM